MLVGIFGFSKIVAALAVIGALLSAGYLLSMFRRVALGKVANQTLTKSWDLDVREVVALLSLAVFVLWVGFYPTPFLNIMHASVEHLLHRSVLNSQ